MRIINKIEQFISESSTGKVTLYRGHGPDNDRGSKDSPFIWFSFDKDLAQRYADYKGGDTVEAFEYRPKNMLEFGRSEQRMDIKSFMARVTSASDINLKSIKREALDLRDVLYRRYGDTARSVAKYWYADEDVAEYVELHGFDSVLTTENGVKTLGILRDLVR